MTQERLRVKNWSQFQHYEHRKSGSSPQWIKLHENLLTDYEFNKLTPAQRYQLVAIWLLASKRGGVISADASFVARQIGVRRVSLDFFVEGGWLETVENGTDSDRPF